MVDFRKTQGPSAVATRMRKVVSELFQVNQVRHARRMEQAADERQTGRGKRPVAPHTPTQDVLQRDTHQQVVATATASSRTSVAAPQGHVQAAMRAPSPGLQLRSVRVTPADALGGPKTQGYGWRAPKATK